MKKTIIYKDDNGAYGYCPTMWDRAVGERVDRTKTVIKVVEFCDRNNRILNTMVKTLHEYTRGQVRTKSAILVNPDTMEPRISVSSTVKTWKSAEAAEKYAQMCIALTK